MLKRVLLSGVCLMAALICYAAGSISGLFLFLCAGVVFEGVFWWQLFGKRRRARKKVIS